MPRDIETKPTSSPAGLDCAVDAVEIPQVIPGSDDVSTDMIADTHRFAQLLRRHRGRSRLSQEQLAERAQLGVRTLRDLERGRTRYPRRDSVRRLATALALTSADRTTFESSSERPSRSSVVPGPGRWDPPTVSRIVDLADVWALREVEDVLTVAAATGEQAVVGVSGPVGVGKTTLAAQCAQLCRTRSGLPTTFVDLRRETDLAGVPAAGRGGGLLVVDDADDADDVLGLVALGFTAAIVTSVLPVPGLTVARQIVLSF